MFSQVSACPRGDPIACWDTHTALADTLGSACWDMVNSGRTVRIPLECILVFDVLRLFFDLFHLFFDLFRFRPTLAWCE